MLKYIRYLSNYLLVLVTVTGFLFDGPWLWLGIGALVLLLLAGEKDKQIAAEQNAKSGIAVYTEAAQTAQAVT